MTRAEIEQLNVEEPNCFETEREEQWYKVGLRDGLNAADAEPHWVSVADELPKHKVKAGLGMFDNVIICTKDGLRDVTYYDDTNKEWADWDGEVTHWMPMPVPPMNNKL